MSLEYVKKKADTRAGKEVEKQKILDGIDEDTEKPLIDFLENAKKGMMDNPPFAHIKRVDQILTDEGLKDIIADVKDTVVRVYTKKEQQQAFNELKGYKDYGSVRLDANGHYQILLNPNLSPSEARRTLYHELMHVKQFKRAETDPYYKKLIDNDTFKIENGIISEDYFNDVLEAEAKQAEIDWENLRGSNNGLHTKRSSDVQSKSSLPRGFIKEDKGIERGGEDNIRGGLSESRERNTSPLRNGSEENRKPISEQLKATDGDLNVVNKILDDVIARDTELSGTDWKVCRVGKGTCPPKLH